MKTFSNIRAWGDHHPKIIDLVRMVLGVILFVKAFAYFNNGPYLREEILQNKIFHQSPFYTTYVQIVCGALIFLGLKTRVASIMLIPLMLGAVFFINLHFPFYNGEIWLSILILALLFLFIVIGSGPWSLDRFLRL